MGKGREVNGRRWVGTDNGPLCNARPLFPAMDYILKLYAPGDPSPAEQAAAQKLFKDALELSLGGAALVWPLFEMHRAIVQQYGEAPDEDDLNGQQRLVFDAWEAAQTAALTAVFGPHRHLDEGGFEILPPDGG